jgi:hypothetical protein
MPTSDPLTPEQQAFADRLKSGPIEMTNRDIAAQPAVSYLSRAGYLDMHLVHTAQDESETRYRLSLRDQA